MGDYVGDLLFGGPGSGLGVHDEGGLQVDDEAAVFHRACGEAGHGCLVVLVVVVRGLEVVFVPGEDFFGEIVGEAAHLFFAAHGPHADGDAVDHLFGGARDIAYDDSA